MKRTRPALLHTLLISLCVIILTGCRRSSKLPDAIGRPSEIVLIDGPHHELRRILQDRRMEGLPQPEYLFDLTDIKPSDFRGDLREAKIIVRYDRGRSLESINDKYAFPQTIITSNGRDPQRLVNAILQAVLRHQQIQLLRHRNIKMEKRVSQLTGEKMLIPQDMTSCKRARHFLWISNNDGRVMKNILIFPAGEKVDSILQRNMPGEEKGMYMQLATGLPNDQRTTDLEKKKLPRKADMLRGLWEMRGDAMGGPYILYHKKNSPWSLMAFVYAPGHPKREPMLELEASLLSFRP
ncbi:DUF4837 family protein [Prevotella sp. AGR2160]|uniref:DUF4837 family protein n=1 Tax=Prevotella sp. AGR2160 TaxID=1280674 RepID=UPI00040D972A|nr:DUF4837 family protein [Prevotella sp. AGR2160]